MSDVNFDAGMVDPPGNGLTAEQSNDLQDFFFPLTTSMFPDDPNSDPMTEGERESWARDCQLILIEKMSARFSLPFTQYELPIQCGPYQANVPPITGRADWIEAVREILKEITK